MRDLNLTLVALHGRDKPTALQELLLDVLGTVSSSLPPSLSRRFRSYGIEQMHATIIGMEADVAPDGCLTGHWLWTNKGVRRQIDVDGLCAKLTQLASSGGPLFRVRFGGFLEARCECRSQCLPACAGWACATAGGASAVFHSCDRSPYEGSFYAVAPGPAMTTGWPVESNGHRGFPHTLYELRRSLEDCGLADKYHYAAGHDRAHWKDDDCFIRVGTFVEAVPEQQLRATEEAVRRFLAGIEPLTIDLSMDDVAFVLYDHPSLLSEHVKKKLKLRDFLRAPSTLERLCALVARSRTGV